MIVIERSDLRNELWQDLSAASDRSANQKCHNKSAPRWPLANALQHGTTVPRRLAKSIREAIALQESSVMDIQLGATFTNLHITWSPLFACSPHLLSVGKIGTLCIGRSSWLQSRSRDNVRNYRFAPYCETCEHESPRLVGSLV